MKDKFRMEFGIAALSMLALLALLWYASAAINEPHTPSYDIVQIEGMTCLVVDSYHRTAISCNWNEWEGR